jgi:hypothetical protein
MGSVGTGDGDAVGADVGGSVGPGVGVSTAGVTVPDVSAGIVNAVGVGVALGVGGFTPELGVGVGRGNLVS